MLVLSTPCSSGSPRSATVEPIEQPPPIEVEFAQWWKCGSLSCWLLKSYCFACQGRGIHWNGFNVQCVFEDYVILLATTVTGGSELRCFNGFVKNGEEVPCCESETEKAIAQCRCRGPVAKNKNKTVARTKVHMSMNVKFESWDGDIDHHTRYTTEPQSTLIYIYSLYKYILNTLKWEKIKSWIKSFQTQNKNKNVKMFHNAQMDPPTTPPRIKCHSRDGSTTKTKRRKQTDKQQTKDQRLKVKQRYWTDIWTYNGNVKSDLGAVSLINKTRIVGVRQLMQL